MKVHVLREMNLDISHCISQCCDGASVMSGCNTGIRTKITDVNPAAVYIHCHAHQLNLVLVDSCKQLNHALDFFSLLYVFISSSVPHSVFMSKQKKLGFKREVQLKQLSDTRWSCRYTSIKAVMSTLNALISTLEQIGDDSNERSIATRGLLHQVRAFPFLLSLVLFEKQLRLLCFDLRSEDVWVQVWDKATFLAEKCNVSVTPPRPQQTHRMPQQLDDSFVIDSTIVTARETSIEGYRTQVYYATIDVLLEKMGNRFSELLTALEALLPTSNLFVDLQTLGSFLTHYNISDTEVEAEVSVVKTFLCERDPDLSFLHKVYAQLTQVPECFPTILRCYQIALSIGVSSATAEKNFSSLGRIKTYLRSTMSQDRLSNLALLNIERDLSSQLWDIMDDLIIRFAETHKIVLY